MLSYLFKRLIAMIPTLLGITFVTFLIVNLAPGDPVSTSLGEGGGGGATESSAPRWTSSSWPRRRDRDRRNPHRPGHG